MHSLEAKWSAKLTTLPYTFMARSLSRVAFNPDAKFEVFKVLNAEFVLFWIVALCSEVAGYQRFRG
jgi:hypothetical protein